MSGTAAAPIPAPAGSRPAPAGSRRARRLTLRFADTDARLLTWAALGALLTGAFALRVWGIWSGLPYSYNLDEDAHFVPRAIGMFGHNLNPHYFANPPAFTYVLHFLYAIWFGGGAGVSHEFALHPGDVFAVSRLAAAALGVGAIWLLYVLGARLFDRGVALLAAAIEAVAFLPVFYSHLALNDVPTLVPLTLSLIGSAGVLRHGRRRDYLLAAVGLGLGCATKYTAGIVLLCLLGAATVRYLDSPYGGGRAVLTDLSIAGAAALAAFLIADPYAILDFRGLKAGLIHQSTVSSELNGKLGAPHESGVLYYLWSLTWGLGWAPSIAALGGSIALWRRDRRLWWVLLPAVIVFFAFMGVQGRYYGRWLMPILPIACLLAAFATLSLVRWAVARWSAARWSAARWSVARRSFAAGRTLPYGLAALATILMLGQGLVYSIHSDLVLSRSDTRALTRAWMVAHVPVGANVVIEPVMPYEWVQTVGRPIAPGAGARSATGAAGRSAAGTGGPTAPSASGPTAAASSGYLWAKYPSLRDVLGPTGRIEPAGSRVVDVEDYERTLSPKLIPFYEGLGYCWVVTGSTQEGRALADPSEVPEAIAYYRALRKAGQVVYRASPYEQGAAPVPFDFDWSFDYYPLSYYRPGPVMTVYRLHGGLCG